MIAEIAERNADLADVLFLIAAVSAGIAAVIRWTAKAWDAALVATAVTLLAVAWLIL